MRITILAGMERGFGVIFIWVYMQWCARSCTSRWDTGGGLGYRGLANRIDRMLTISLALCYEMIGADGNMCGGSCWYQELVFLRVRVCSRIFQYSLVCLCARL